MRIVTKFILAVSVFLSAVFCAQAQENEEWKYQLPKECWDAMIAGEHQIVAKYFAPSVELTLPSGSGLYSSKQATVILQDFFSTSTVSRADIGNERQTGKSIMMIATFEISNRPYRVYILTQQGQNGCQIQKLRIEEDK